MTCLGRLLHAILLGFNKDNSLAIFSPHTGRNTLWLNGLFQVKFFSTDYAIGTGNPAVIEGLPSEICPVPLTASFAGK